MSNETDEQPRPDDERLVEQWAGGPPGMPPFPGLDLFDPDDFAFWYGDGSGGHKLPEGSPLLEASDVEQAGKVDYDRVQEFYRTLGAPLPAAASCPHGDVTCTFGSGSCDRAR